VRHSVLILVDDLDRPAAQALQYARTLQADERRAVHAAADPVKAARLAERWQNLNLTRVPLDLVDCPDRRLARSVLDVVADEVADGRTEVTVLIPRREYQHRWHRLLHDRTSNQLAKAVGRIPHANVTFVPYHLGSAVVPAEERAAYHAAKHH
jgi:hypothetical protein